MLKIFLYLFQKKETNSGHFQKEKVNTGKMDLIGKEDMDGKKSGEGTDGVLHRKGSA